MALYYTEISNESFAFPPHAVKTLYTEANDCIEAASKFNRFMACQWAGRPWNDDPIVFLSGVFDKLIDGEQVDITANGVSIDNVSRSE